MIWLVFYNALIPFFLFLAAIAGLFSPRIRQWMMTLFRADQRRERWGMFRPTNGANCWIHLASLGEARSLSVFLHSLKNRHPSIKIHVTCMTEAGIHYVEASYLRENLVDGVSLLPIDWWPVMKRQVDFWPPGSLLILMETELWPSLIVAAKKRGFKLALINGHFSQKTLRWFFWAKSLARMILESFDVICVSEESYQENLIDLIANNEIIKVTGNVKWDAAVTVKPANAQFNESFRRRFGRTTGDFYWVCASTREGEEAIILSVYQRLLDQYGFVKLVLAPRHIERAAEVLRLSQSMGLTARLWSKSDGYSNLTIVDEFGILGDFYELSDAVFVGGSLVPNVGGHNFLEPAYLGKPIVIGRYVENFKDIAREFERGQALRFVSGGEELFRVLEQWIKNSQERDMMGERARSLFSFYQGGSERTVKALGQLLK